MTGSTLNDEQNMKSVGDVAKDIYPEFIKSADLAGHGKFAITGARLRTTGQYGPECVYNVTLLEGPLKGSNGVLTLAANEGRERWVEAVKKHGTIGPIRLVKAPTQNGREAWALRDAGDDAKQTELQLKTEAKAATNTAVDEDDLPF